MECDTIWEEELMPLINETFLNIMDLHIFQYDFPRRTIQFAQDASLQEVIDYKTLNEEAHEKAEQLMRWTFEGLHSVLSVLWMSSVRPLSSGATNVQLEIKNYHMLHLSVETLRQLVDKLKKHPANICH